MKLLIIYTFSLFAFLSLSGCQTLETRGQFIDNSLLAEIEGKKLTKAQIEGLIGSPTIIPDYSLNSWYYVERTMSKRAWFRPKVVQQRIVKIMFDTNFVDRIEIINDSHNEEVRIVEEYTKTYGTELSGIQKFVKNIGRFNQTSQSKKKKK